MERRGLSGRCVTRTEIVQTYPSVQGRMEKIERKGEKKVKGGRGMMISFVIRWWRKGKKGAEKLGWSMKRDGTTMIRLS